MFPALMFVQIDAAGGSHRCNAFKEADGKPQDKAELDATRYLHFYERWTV